jgi:hypothetical protein
MAYGAGARDARALATSARLAGYMACSFKSKKMITLLGPPAVATAMVLFAMPMIEESLPVLLRVTALASTTDTKGVAGHTTLPSTSFCDLAVAGFFTVRPGFFGRCANARLNVTLRSVGDNPNPIGCKKNIWLKFRGSV